ncbi:MAG TPA: phosphoribosylaminoimidazolesuccinocarboxamide synthase [Syntrophorhabdales bacterium]|nr:phosphoribosylaminoimidazolesuccinocarboxamide synthase [Syntrophorhabdales bacterium]
MEKVITQTQFPSLSPPRRGKVRDVYDLGEQLLIVATDRISAFDVVLPTAIPDKGRVLTQLSLFWFHEMRDVIENHLVETDVDKYPEALRKYRDQLQGRSMVVKKAKTVPAECVVRGYLTGSGWKDYKESGSVCGITLTPNLVESAKLPEPIFTPSTKAEVGHDTNMSFDDLVRFAGQPLAEQLRDVSVRIFKRASEIAEKRGILIADTKFEFGIIDGKLKVIDEMLTPDSSRFWSAKEYRPGKPQESYDKQIVRDYLNTLDWNKTSPGPELPPEIVEKARARYIEILKILTGKGLE